MATHAEPGGLSGGPGYRATASPLKPAITRPMLLSFIIGDILSGRPRSRPRSAATT